jgi:hypothetical protein
MANRQRLTYSGHRMRRRELMLLLGGAMTAARTPRAQQRAMPVVGLLSSFSRGPNPLGSGPLTQGLSETGYVYGQNVAIEYRWAESNYDRLPALAADLVRGRCIGGLDLRKSSCHNGLSPKSQREHRSGKR